MRLITIAFLVCLFCWSNPSARAWVETVFVGTHDPRVAAAIEARCASELPAFRDECAHDLQRDFELGVIAPEAILRRHCTRVSSDWAAPASEVDAICEEIYGGWIES